MYNRYLRSDEGEYTRIPMPDPPPRQQARRSPPPPPPCPPEDDPPKAGTEASQFFSRLIDKLPLKGVDTGDILLLLILFFLFEEKADDELLIALGLLLIL